MAVYKATKLLAAIEEQIHSDQGSKYREALGKVIPHMDDAYRADNFPFRSHLGASGIGNECARSIWYSWRWATLTNHSGRLLRLFNRGHLEEARFIAMLLAIDCEVYQQDENGQQFKISDAGGHYGGSGDGVIIGVPDLDPGTPALGEFKTSAAKGFLKVQKEGVRKAKFEHYVQMQQYMKKMGLAVALYMVVNKDDDNLYAELVPFDGKIADEYLNRGIALVWKDTPPQRISESPGWYECKWCDDYKVCHKGAAPHRNCRTCIYSQPKEDGKWHCTNQPEHTVLTKEEQLAACDKYVSWGT